jgi:hypothetical protein
MPFLNRGPAGDGWRLTSEVDLRQLAPREVKFWAKAYFRVLTEFRYADPRTLDPANGGAAPSGDLAVPAEVEKTDLASVPPFLWGVLSSYGSHTMPALLHDRLCNVAESQRPGGAGLRRWADKHFRRMLRDEARAGIATRWAMWAAVRLFSFIPLALVALAWIISGYAWLAWSVLGDAAPSWPAWSTLALTVLVLLLAVVRSVEEPRLRFTEGGSSDGSPRRFRALATASFLGAAVIAFLVAPLFAPVVVVTLAVRFTLLLVDFLLWLLVVPLRWLGGYPSVQEALTSPGDDGVAPSFSGFSPKGAAVSLVTEPRPVLGTVFPRP